MLERAECRAAHVLVFSGLSSVVQQFYQCCTIGLKYNVRKSVPVAQGAFVPPLHSFQKLQIDFSQMPKIAFQYNLVVICMFSSWIKTYPCAAAEAITFVKKLLKEFYPHVWTP